jgi:hypothetical protein
MPPSPVFKAFRVLYRAAAPDRRDLALRAGIAALIGPEARRGTAAFVPAPTPSSSSPSAPSTRWEGLRIRLRELAGNDPGQREAVARSIGVSATTFSKLLAPGSSGPGQAVIGRAEAWLDAQSVGLTNDETATKSTGRAADSRPAPKPNGRSDPHKLTEQQREALALLLDLDGRAIRKAGVTAELAQRAAAGQAVPIEAIDKLTAFLTR